MKFPKFMKTDDKAYFEVTKKKKSSTLKTGLFLTPNVTTKKEEITTTTWQSAQPPQQQAIKKQDTPKTPTIGSAKAAVATSAKTDYNLIYNLTKTTTKTKSATKLFSPTGMLIKTFKSSQQQANSNGRFTKNSKRLQRNHLILNGSKIKRSESETPVCAYINEKNKIKCQKIDEPITPIIKFVENKNEASPSINATPKSTSQKDLKNLFKTSLSQLSKFVSKSKLMQKSPDATSMASSDSSNYSSSTSSPTSSCSSSANTSPIVQNPTPKVLLNKLTTDNGSRRPIMGISALMLQNYKAQTNYSNGIVYPNLYLIGLPIVFNSNDNQIEQQPQPPKSSKKRNLRSTTSQCRLQIYGSSDSDNIDDCIL